jgi:hypothetical protein
VLASTSRAYDSRLIVAHLALHYEGPLPTESAHRVAAKHIIRKEFHGQLLAFCKAHPVLNQWPGILAVTINDEDRKVRSILKEFPLKGTVIQFPEWAVFGIARVGPYACVPLVTRKWSSIVHVKVQFYRREQPGAILQGGDIDARLKTLFDALRMPHEANQITDAPEGADERLFCLLEDDSLITSVAVETHRLWQPPRPGGKESDVRIVAHVDIERIAD